MISEKQLATRFNWWWRFITEAQKKHIWGAMFLAEWTRSAFMYELGKRVTGAYEFGVPYCALAKAQLFQLAARWPMHVEGPVARCDLSFDLTLPDATLARYFLWFIHEEQKRLGIRPRRGNEGKANRGVSWKPIELLDIRNHKIRSLNNSERSQASKAETDYRASI